MPAVLEMLGIPYSGSDPLTLAATLDKDVAKRLVGADVSRFRGAGLLTPGTRTMPASSMRDGSIGWSQDDLSC